MGADGNGDSRRAYRRRRPRRRPSGRAAGIVWIARARRVAASEGDRDRLAEDHSAPLAHGIDRGGVAQGLVSFEQHAAEFRRHIDRFDQILHADRHAVDQR